MNLQEIEKRLADIKVELEKETDEEVNIEQLEKEVNDLTEERKVLLEKAETRKTLLDEISKGKVETETVEDNKEEKEERKVMNTLDSKEYRKAFMDYALKGQVAEEYRVDATTKTTDIGMVIPTTVMQKIVQDLKSYGHIFNRVTLSNVKGGYEIPTSDSRPTATWTAEGTTSDTQKKEVKGKVSFSYHKLQCKVAVTLEASITSLDVFEEQVVADITEAMLIAIEEAIVNGNGEGKPTGILNSNVTNIVDFTSEEIGSWEKWSTTFAKLPLGKRNGSVVVLNSETFEGNIDGAVDKNGQPIARVNYGLDGGVTGRLKGKEVVMVEGLLPSFEDAETNEVFGFVMNLKDYQINTNMAMTLRRYFDEDLDEYVQKATMLGDGKLVNKQGVVLLRKVADTPSA